MQSGTARSETVRVSAQLNLRVLRWDGALPGFVLVHGLASNALLWREGAEMLSQGDPRAGWGHAVTEIDLRGHGESDVPASGYDTATATGDVAAVIATLGLGRPVVAGQSWGGNVAVELAATFPHLVAAIALVDGGWICPSDTFASWAEVLQKLTPPDLGDRSWPEVSAMVQASHPDWAVWAIEATLANLRELPDGSVRARLAREHHLSILRSMWDHSIADRYSAVAVPSLLVPAGSRAGAKLAAVEQAARGLTRAGSRPEVRWYDGADHDLHAQHPGRLAGDLRSLAQRAQVMAAGAEA